VRYLRAVLEASRGPKLRFEANVHNAPAVIQPLNEEEVLYLVMPMHHGQEKGRPNWPPHSHANQ